MQMTPVLWFLYDCCWFPALLSGQEPHDPHHATKSSQWLASYWVHYSKGTAVIWIDSLCCDWGRDSKAVCVWLCETALEDALIYFFQPFYFSCSLYPFFLSVHFHLPIYRSAPPRQNICFFPLSFTWAHLLLTFLKAVHTAENLLPFYMNCSSSLNTSSFTSFFFMRLLCFTWKQKFITYIGKSLS